MNTDIEQLEKRIQNVLQQQELLSQEVSQLKRELINLQYSQKYVKEDIVQEDSVEKTIIPEPNPIVEQKPVVEQDDKPEVVRLESFFSEKPKASQPKEKSSWEKFIGENLINKVGIIITIIGAAIGVKYSIDNQLLSPLVRICLGYLLGAALLGFGIKLKRKYLNYSAVLVSGSIAILYFITFAGYSFYALIPQMVAFLMMLLFTGFSVFVSIYYNRQVIAHIGLVGAYAIPFLLSENSGNTLFLFIYMAIINIGILCIAYKKYWKPLYFSSFALTWIIFFSWYISRYSYNYKNFAIAFTFLAIFFAIFYCMFLIYKLVRKENYSKIDMIPLLVNSFLFYGIGFSLIDSQISASHYVGLFTLANAVIHSLVCLIIWTQKLADKKLFYFTSVLVLTFVTITIPVWLTGSWITLLWVAEAAFLFCIGRYKRIAIFEKMSYPILFLAFFSLIQDWVSNYSYWSVDFPIFLNVYFLTSVFAIIAFVGVNYFYFSSKYQLENPIKKTYSYLLSFCIPAMLLLTVYFSFYSEIASYWTQIYNTARNVEEVSYPFLSHIEDYKHVWILNYSLLFAAALSVVNQLITKNRILGFCSASISSLFMLLFLTIALPALGNMRSYSLEMSNLDFSTICLLRYASFALVGVTLFLLYRKKKQTFMQPLSNELIAIFEYVLHISILWILSSELINWLEIGGYAETYKLGLSILWGIYAVLLVVLGIWKGKKHLRIGSFVLLGVTLLKVCFYDLSQLNTLSKTVILIVLGIFLLIISFLYNKYKYFISGDK